MTAETPHSPAYRDALQFLYSFIDYERNSRWKYDDAHFDLGRVREFFHALGDPHERGAFVHVAGTNGKGSTAAMRGLPDGPVHVAASHHLPRAHQD